jgi:hypothetical protein
MYRRKLSFSPVSHLAGDTLDKFPLLKIYRRRGDSFVASVLSDNSLSKQIAIIHFICPNGRSGGDKSSGCHGHRKFP